MKNQCHLRGSGCSVVVVVVVVCYECYTASNNNTCLYTFDSRVLIITNSLSVTDPAHPLVASLLKLRLEARRECNGGVSECINAMKKN